MKRYLWTDPNTRKEVSLHQNSDGSTHVEQRQEFGDLLKINKQMSDDYRPGSLRGTFAATRSATYSMWRKSPT
jgi:hypothetical protein